MELNLSIISDYLAKTMSTKLYGSSSNVRALERPRLYQANGSIQSGQLYVAEAKDLPQNASPASCSIICTDGKIPIGWLHGNHGILQAKGDLNAIDLFHAVQEIFDFFQAWELELCKALSSDSGFDICHVIRLGSEILENPISMMDASMQVIFSSDFTSDGKIVVNTQPQKMGLYHAQLVKSACHQERTIRAPYLSSLNTNGYRTYCYNLYPMDHFAGCAYICDSNRPFRDSDFSLADFYFPIFLQAYQKYLRTITDVESPKVTALRKMLKHKPTTTQETEMFQLKEGEHWRCFKLREKDLSHSMPTDYMYATLSALLPGAVLATFLSGSIVGLLKFEDNSETMALFQDLLHRMDYFCGVSNAFTDIQRLDDHFLQAEFVVETFAETDGNLRYFQNCLLPYLLSQCQRNLPLADLKSEGLAALRRYDCQRGTELMKTLDTYLQNEMSISRTSEALYIHRSSLLKRLDKITRLTGLDLGDADIRLYLRLFFRLQQTPSPHEPPHHS